MYFFHICRRSPTPSSARHQRTPERPRSPLYSSTKSFLDDDLTSTSQHYSWRSNPSDKQRQWMLKANHNAWGCITFPYSPRIQKTAHERYTNKTTRVMVFGPGNPRSRGFPVRRPSWVCFCSLRNHMSVVLYLSYAAKTTEKQLLIPHAKLSRWRHANMATTSRRPVQQYAWRHWDSAMTLMQQRKSVYHICCIWYFYTTARSPDSMGHILLSFLRNISRWW
jgi:hypothetical protein